MGYGFGQAVNITIPIESLSADEVAEGIMSIERPAKDATTLGLPTVLEGFSVSIKTSSMTNVISTDGGITPPATDTTVELVLTVVRTADGTSADTSAISILVPAKTVASSLNGYIMAGGKLVSGISVTIKSGTTTIY